MPKHIPSKVALLLAAVFLLANRPLEVAEAKDASTLEVFLTDDGMISTDSSGNAVFQNWQLEAARKAKESRPAHLDPEGNWGEPSAGMQMSIRLEKSSYKVGEPVEAIIIMRNLDQKPREYRLLWPLELGFGLSLFVSGRSTPLPTMAEARATDEGMKRMARSVYKGHTFGLSPGTQKKFEVPLSAIYDLTRPGSYQIMASRDIPDPDTGGKSLISTKAASFEIVSGDGQDNRTNAPSSGSPGSPLMPPTESRQTGAVPVTSFRSKTGLPQPSEGGTPARPSVPPSLAEAGSTSTYAEKGWTWGFLFAAIAAFVGSILWVLRRRSGRP